MPDQPDGFVFTRADLDEWTRLGLIDPAQRDAIAAHLASQPRAAAPAAERPGAPRFDTATVAIYFGAFLILLAWTVFMGLRWQRLSHPEQTAISVFTVAALLLIGAFLRRAGHLLAGNLLVFAGTGVVPLVVYSALNWAGLWPSAPAADAYADFYVTIHGNWVILELVSIAAALAAILWTRFPLLTLLVAFWTWYLSMDITRVFADRSDRSWGDPEWIVGSLFGAAMLAIGLRLRRARGTDDWSRWFWLFGHIALLCNLGLLALDRGGAAGIFFLLVYLGVVVASARLQSRMWLVFGALGCYAYVARLAFEVFADSLGFPIVLALVGLLIVLSAVAYERWLRPRLEQRFASGGPAAAAA